MSLSYPSRHISQPKGNRAMKPKDRMFPTVDEQYQLRLQQVVSESDRQRRWNHSGVDRQFALRGTVIDPIDDQVCKSAITRH
jgi:hypothetical protein